MADYDYIIVGAGSGGCAAAYSLAKAEAGTVLVLEAGKDDDGALVKTPIGLIWLMGGGRDWALRSTPQAALDGRQVSVPRGKMIGGSSSINSMVWFRGRRDDFDRWNLPGWDAATVWQAYDAVEAQICPERLRDPHPLSEGFAPIFGQDRYAPPTPERVSGGVCHYNMRGGRRWSAADAFLRPALKTGRVTVRSFRGVDRLRIEGDRAAAVTLTSGGEITARKGIILAAGSIGSPEIAMRSGIGPADDLRRLGIHVIVDAPGVGENLHDHPAIALHHAGPASGYGLTWAQAAHWAVAPLVYASNRTGPFASPTVEACAFFASDGGDMPDVQMHFIPFMIGWKGRAIVPGAGYYADVCVSRPTSRGRLRLAGASPKAGSEIDLNLLSDDRDMQILTQGVHRLREVLRDAPFGKRRAQEVFPGPQVRDDAAIRRHIRARASTSYHPVGTLAMGRAKARPVTGKLAMKGLRGLWVADASVMPAIPSSNTNAPSMMIGLRAGQFAAEAT